MTIILDIDLISDSITLYTCYALTKSVNLE